MDKKHAREIVEALPSLYPTMTADEEEAIGSLLATDIPDDARDAFMNLVYDELHSDGDNNWANRIIDAADEYVEYSLAKQSAQPEQRKEILYRHYKGGIYELVCNGVTHTETGESLVIYRDCRGKLLARPESMFYGLVKVGDDLVPRFVLCRSEGDAE